MKKLICILFIGITFLQASPAIEKKSPYYYINKSIVDLHQRQMENSQVITQAIYATPVVILGKDNSWIKIRLPDNYVGWVRKKNIYSRTTCYPKSKNVAKVHSLWAHVYKVANVIAYKPELTIPFETTLELVSPLHTCDQRWIQVRLLDDSVKWVQRAEYEINPHKLSIPETIELSKSFLDIPYQWGGTTTFGFDCSGFVQMLYRQMGIQIPRDSNPQSTFSQFVSVEKKDLQPGDLIFFGQGKVGHVGMYIGNQKFIHSNIHADYALPKVVISDLHEKCWKKLYKCARRYSH